MNVINQTSTGATITLSSPPTNEYYIVYLYNKGTESFDINTGLDIFTVEPNYTYVLLYDRLLSGGKWKNIKCHRVELTDLIDVDLSSIQTGDILYYDGTSWVNKQQTTTDLTDIDQTNKTTNSILQYDGTDYKHIQHTLNNISDVSTSGITDG
jgi:hypothetical protein